MIGALVRAPLPPVLREVGRRDDVLVVRIGVDDAELERLLAAAGAAEDGRAGTGGAAVPEPVTKAVTDLDEVEVDHPLAAEPVGHLVLISGTMTDLRRAVAVRSLLPPARNITIAVGALPYLWPAPLPTATAHPGWRHLTDVHIRVVEKRSWVMEAEFAEPLPAGEVLAATARAFGGDPIDTMPQPRAALAGTGVTHWRPGDPNAVLTPTPDKGATPGKGDCDVVLVAGADPGADGEPCPDGAPAREEEPPVVARPGPVGWTRFTEPGHPPAAVPADPTMVPPVDERAVNPGGFLQTPPHGFGDLEPRAGRWAAVYQGRALVTFAASGAVTDADVARLRRLRGLRVRWRLSHTGPVPAARVIAGLAAAGVPLIAPDPPEWVRPLLGAGLTDLIARVTEADLADDLDREVFSVRLRRLALRAHGTRGRWHQLTAGEVPGHGPYETPKVSVVLCTRRADMVRFAVSQVARQRGVDLELVLGLHGIPLARVAEAVRGLPFPVTAFEADPALPFGAVLNEGFARASGTFVTKMDDDDWYGPDHLADLALAHVYTGAELIGAPAEFVHLEQIDVTVQRSRRTECFRDSVAGGTLFLTRTLFETIGGFRPVPRHVDGELCKAVRAAGGRIYQIHGLNYILRRRTAQGHTWREPIGYFLARRNRRQWRGWYANPLMEL